VRTPQARDIDRVLLAWYRKSRRDLPWRRTRDPYRIWVSEVMLQQTSVRTVIPYYERFIHRFPTVRTLARARLDRVLAVWSGLGRIGDAFPAVWRRSSICPASAAIRPAPS
jgi:A/G-specific adenine glycosylase